MLYPLSLSDTELQLVLSCAKAVPCKLRVQFLVGIAEKHTSGRDVSRAINAVLIQLDKHVEYEVLER